jgi:hypothetical protein
MKKKVIALLTILGISTATIAPADAWYGGYYGGWGYGGGAAIAGLAVGALAGAAIAGGGYYGGYGGWGYGGYRSIPYYNGGYPVYVPAYAAPPPVYSTPSVRKNIIIKNSPGATVIEEDDIFSGW